MKKIFGFCYDSVMNTLAFGVIVAIMTSPLWLAIGIAVLHTQGRI